MERKYELIKTDFIEVTGHTLYRIKALKSFCDVKAGDLGGYIEGEHNLSHEGDCWVFHKAKVYDNAKVYGNAIVAEYAKVGGDVRIDGDIEISGFTNINNKTDFDTYIESIG